GLSCRSVVSVDSEFTLLIYLIHIINFDFLICLFSILTVNISWTFRYLFFFCCLLYLISFFFFSSRRRHTRSKRDWSSDVCSSDLPRGKPTVRQRTRTHPGRQKSRPTSPNTQSTQ